MADGVGTATQGIADNQAATQALLSQETAEMKPHMTEVNRLLAEPRPTPPATEPQPKAPDMAGQQQSDIAKFLPVAIALAGLGGAISRQHITGALTSLGAAVKGMRQGQLDEFDKASKEFQEHADAVSRTNTDRLNAYKEVMADRKASIDEQMASIQMIATRYHDPLVAQAAADKNFLLLGQMIDRQQEQLQKFELAVDALGEKKKEFDDKLKQQLQLKGFKRDDSGNIVADTNSPAYKAQVDISDGALDAAAYRYIQTNTIPAGFSGKDLRVMVMNRAADIAAKAGVTPAQLAAVPQEKRAEAASLVRDVAWLDGTTRQQQILEGMLPIAEEYMKQLPLTEIRRVNQLIVAGMTEFGSAEANNYGNAMRTVAMEYGRLMAGPQSAAMLPVEAMRQGMARMGNLTPDQFAGEKVLIQQEADNNVRAQSKIINRRAGTLENIFGSLGTGDTGGGNAPPGAGTGKQPTAQDRQWAKDHPEDHDAFVREFGVEP